MLALIVSAQSDPLLSWRRQNRVGTRYEGLVQEKAGYPQLELLSFTTYVPDRFEKKQRLSIRYVCEPGQRIQIIARELKVWWYYRMEAPIDSADGALSQACNGNPETYDGWETAQVIDKYDLQASNLGILARVAGETRALQVVPTEVYVHDKPAIPSPNRYTFWFRADSGLAEASLTVVPVEPAGRSGDLGKTYARKTTVPSRQPFKLEIPFQDLPHPGLYTATLVPKFTLQNTTNPLVFRFLHRPLQ